MKPRTSFSKGKLLRKDITRFAPLWSIYLIGGLLVVMSIVSHESEYRTARNLSDTLIPFTVINMIYAALCAQVLFGDLFKSRMCNALHAMPPRREHWFAIHTVAGLLFSLVPNTIGVLCLLPGLKNQWAVGLGWLLGMELQFLFFFGLAVFCSMCAGNRLAAVCLYGMINFAAPITTWIISTIYVPMLPGVVVNADSLDIFCPVSYIMGLDLMKTVPESLLAGFEDFIWVPDWHQWTYLFVVAFVGTVLLVLSLLMYRRRKLETAGDFMAVRALNPVFSVAYTIFVGALFAMFGSAMGKSYLVFLLVGVVVGYFTGQMLLRRTVKVFQGKTFIRFACVAAVITLSLVAIWLDIFGIASWVPKVSRVDTAVVYIGGVETELTEQEDIAKLSEIHKALINMEEPEWGEDRIWVELRYEMKYGITATREYQMPYRDEMEQLRALLSQTNIVLWSKDPEVLHSQLDKIKIGKTGVPEELQSELLEAIIADCEAGLMVQNNMISSQIYTNLTVEYRAEGGWTVIVPVRVSYASIHTYQWIEIHKEELGLG